MRPESFELKPVTFKEYIHAYLEHGFKAEDLDKLWVAEKRAGKHADFLHRGHRLLIETKDLEDDRTEILDPILREHVLELPEVAPGTPVWLDELIARHPEGEEIERTVRRVARSTLKSALYGANEQLKRTKHALVMPDAIGVALIINSGNAMLQPRDIEDVVREELNLKHSWGWALESVHAVALILLTHALACEGPPLSNELPAGRLLFLNLHREPQHRDVVNELLMGFAPWHGTTAELFPAQEPGAIGKLPTFPISKPHVLTVNIPSPPSTCA